MSKSLPAGDPAPSENENSPEVTPEAESCPVPVPEAALPQPAARKPKRLTLQERLALAAKAKKKTVGAEAESRIESIEPEVVNNQKKIEIEPIKIAEKPASEPDHEHLTSSEAAMAQMKNKLDQLSEENKQLKANATSTAITAELGKKLAEKDATIKQLMEEGETLSKRELKLNDRIKTLSQTNSKLEASLKSYSEKNEETLLKLSEIEEIMKVHKLKSVDQLLELLEDSNLRLQEAQHALEKERSSNWEAKYKELQRIYETELNEKKSYIKQLNESSLQLQMLQQQSKLDLQSKEDLISHLNREIVEIRDENSAEINRLESKIEGLRLENESFLKMSQYGADSSQDGSDTHLKQIDYQEYAKLSETHRNLQDQYVSSQENWKLIEYNLLSKVDNLSSSLESLRKAKLKTTNEVRKLNNQLSTMAEQEQKLKQEIATLREDKKELALQLQVKASEHAELEEKLEELKTVFNADRQNYDMKIKTLSDTIHKYEEQAQIYQSSASSDNISNLQSRRIRDSGLHINLESRSMPMRNFSSNSMASMGTPLQQWEDSSVLVGGTDTPYGIGQHHFSSSSLTEEINPFDAPEIGPMDLSYNYKGETPTIPSSGATKNIQLINKMSSSIRRLELELMSLKEENERLSAEKDSAQKEIVGKYDLEKQVSKLEESIRMLEEEVAARTKKEETLLELIGEKSERVAELQADVVDLKDLCRQQVHQMIEMTSK